MCGLIEFWNCYYSGFLIHLVVEKAKCFFFPCKNKIALRNIWLLYQFLLNDIPANIWILAWVKRRYLSSPKGSSLHSTLPCLPSAWFTRKLLLVEPNDHVSQWCNTNLCLHLVLMAFKVSFSHYKNNYPWMPHNEVLFLSIISSTTKFLSLFYQSQSIKLSQLVITISTPYEQLHTHQPFLTCIKWSIRLGLPFKKIRFIVFWCCKGLSGKQPLSQKCMALQQFKNEHSALN